MIDKNKAKISLKRQCEILKISRSGLYYQSQDREELEMMRLIDQLYTQCPFYGSRRIAKTLSSKGFFIGRKKARRLMRKRGLEAMYPKPSLSKANSEHKKYPYLLRGKTIDRVNQVWSTDITYIPLKNGFAYLVVVMDWYSRFILSWQLSNLLDADFCIETLERALQKSKPDIFNSDQGSQFTCKEFVEKLEDQEILLSMDGRGRALDNIFVERLWRSLKYEDIYLKDYATMEEAQKGIGEYIQFYNKKRVHQSLEYQTPFEVYIGNCVAEPIEMAI